MNDTKAIVFDYTEGYTFRVSSVKLKDKIIERIQELTVSLNTFLDSVEELLPSTKDSVICLVAILQENWSVPNTVNAYSLAKKAADIQTEINELNAIVRNLQVGTTVFYDLTIEDAKRFRL